MQLQPLLNKTFRFYNRQPRRRPLLLIYRRRHLLQQPNNQWSEFLKQPVSRPTQQA
jgi:hypothetical protein